MATLSSSSTDQEIWAAYDDNASYEEEGDAGKARVFITACRILLRRRPKRSAGMGREGSEIEFDPTMLREELRDAQTWLTRQSTLSAGGAGVKHASFRNFRD